MKLSIGMMVKNEGKHLEQCLKALQPIRTAIKSELVIVDTGSEDNTVEIAKRFTDKVYFHEWNNNFSEMRNITINYCQGEWFLCIDGDEILDDPQPIINFLTGAESKKYKSALILINNLTDENDLSKYSSFLAPRLFKKTKNFHFEGAIHNQPVFEGPTVSLETSLWHYGYMATDKELMDRKFMRTSEILKSELEKNPEHIYYWYQLSVTYAMHKDMPEAIQACEKAYELTQMRNDKEKYMYVYTHKALVYEMMHDFTKVEAICLEALKIKEGYIDIYYHLAEAQAVLKKYQESIDAYHKYLELLDKPELATRDTSVVAYTLGSAQTAFHNLSNLYKQLGQYEEALVWAEKVTNPKSMQDNFATIIYLYLKTKLYQKLRSYYQEHIPDNTRDLFLNTIETVKMEFGLVEQFEIASQFADLDNHYGLLSRLVLEEESQSLSSETLANVQKLEMAQIPIYCGEILYYLAKRGFPFHTIFVSFKDLWLDTLFNYIAKRRSDLNEVLLNYLAENTGNSFSENKVNKALCRYSLQLTNTEDTIYFNVFMRYVKHGIDYIQALYNSEVIQHEWIHEVKSDEEIFFIYMYKANIYYQNEPAKYINYLRKALVTLPIMKRAIELLLADVTDAEKKKQKEFDAYKGQIKSTIRELLDENKLEDARMVLNEYKSIVPNDIEILLFESQLAVQEMENSTLN